MGLVEGSLLTLKPLALRKGEFLQRAEVWEYKTENKIALPGGNGRECHSSFFPSEELHLCCNIGSSRLGLFQPEGGSQEVKQHAVAKGPRAPKARGQFRSASLGNQYVCSASPRGRGWSQRELWHCSLPGPAQGWSEHIAGDTDGLGLEGPVRNMAWLWLCLCVVVPVWTPGSSSIRAASVFGGLQTCQRQSQALG